MKRSISIVLMFAAALLAMSADAAKFPLEPGAPLVTDAHGAIVIARAMMVAERPDDPAIRSEEQWLAHATARLEKGVWYVTDKPPHKWGEGYFIGSAVIKVGAQDGRLLGELFAD